MLGLAEQVGSAHLAVCRVVGKHEDLGRSGEQVDADPAEQLALRLRDKGIARTNDLVDRLDGLRPIGQCCNRLCPANPVNFVNTGNPCGGQNQRVGIARAMILEPKLVSCDEAVSALDVSVQAQVVDLLIELQKEFGLAMIFISHDLAAVRQISHRVMVLYLGRVVELADRTDIYEDARHPYTKALIAAVPNADPKSERTRTKVTLEGDLPSPLDSRAALRFMKSKLIDDPDAQQYQPRLVEVSPGHVVAEHDAVLGTSGLTA